MFGLLYYTSKPKKKQELLMTKILPALDKDQREKSLRLKQWKAPHADQNLVNTKQRKRPTKKCWIYFRKSAGLSLFCGMLLC